MSQLLLDLRGVPGFEPEKGLRNLGMHEQSFVRVLRRFVEVYKHGDPGLAAASGLDGVREAARGLRSMGEIVGALHMCWLAERLELRCRQSHRLKELQPYILELNAALSQLATAIRSRLIHWVEEPP